MNVHDCTWHFSYVPAHSMLWVLSAASSACKHHGELYQQPVQMIAGTYKGLVEKLDYLQTLGINAIELLPVQEFNELEYYQVHLQHLSLNPIVFFLLF